MKSVVNSSDAYLHHVVRSRTGNGPREKKNNGAVHASHDRNVACTIAHNCEPGGATAHLLQASSSGICVRATASDCSRLSETGVSGRLAEWLRVACVKSRGLGLILGWVIDLSDVAEKRKQA